MQHNNRCVLSPFLWNFPFNLLRMQLAMDNWGHRSEPCGSEHQYVHQDVSLSSTIPLVSHLLFTWLRESWVLQRWVLNTAIDLIVAALNEHWSLQSHSFLVPIELAERLYQQPVGGTRWLDLSCQDRLSPSQKTRGLKEPRNNPDSWETVERRQEHQLASARDKEKWKQWSHVGPSFPFRSISQEDYPGARFPWDRKKKKNRSKGKVSSAISLSGIFL